jgi:soluble lytic murein transglycosylase
MRPRRARRFGDLLAFALILAAAASAVIVHFRWKYREQRYNRLIEKIAAESSVDKFLIKAVVRRESEFDPFAYGSHGEIGLMQVTEAAGRDWARATGRHDFGRDLLWDERVNLRAGAWYLQRAMRRWADKDNPLPFALAEYNAGWGNVQRWLPNGAATTADEFRAAITIPSVRKYLDTVAEFYAAYRAEGRL